MSQTSGESSPKKGASGPMSRWIAPSFSSDMLPPTSSTVKKAPVKRPRRQEKEKSSTSMLAKRAVQNATAKTTQRNSKLAWVDKYAPVVRSELAVHSKKIDEVYTWLEIALKQSHKAPILALTGPPGSGKTATLKVASREMDFLIREWITPLNNNVVTEDFDGNKIFEPSYRSEYDLVRDFLLRTSRFPSVLVGEQNKQSVVLMEDIPLTFLRDPGLLLEVLWEYVADGRSPLVMIIGDNKIFRKLLTDSIISQLNIKVIEFNPVAMTIMTKLLQKITQQESQNVVNKTFQTPNTDVINSIYESSCGDLRSAINTLQFACLRGGTNTAKAVTGKIQNSPKKSSAKKAKLVASKVKETEFAAIGGRDTPDDFFRVIGRVLYAKRDPQQEGGPLVHNPQDIVRSYSGSAEFFTGFLHENYLKHFSSNIEAVRKVADYFSVADVIMNPGVMNGMELAKQLGLSVSVQGMMHNHPGKSTSTTLGFKPHHKPRSIAAEHAYHDRRDQARQMFPNSHCSNYELLTELVPYITQIGTADYHTEAQKNFIESSRLGTLGSGHSFRMSAQPRTVQQPIGSVPRNGLKTNTAVENDDDAMLIEEFPDSD